MTRELPINPELCKKALATFGTYPQLRKAQEEAGELVVALAHFLDRRGGAENDLAYEVADVLIMCHQIRLVLGSDLVDRAIEYKMGRLAGRLQ